MQNDQVTPKETAAILELAEKCLPVAGDFVELGCYRGDTSVLLGKLLAKHTASCGKTVDKLCKNTADECKTSNQTVENQCKTPERHLWIYDSFAGLP